MQVQEIDDTFLPSLKLIESLRCRVSHPPGHALTNFCCCHIRSDNHIAAARAQTASFHCQLADSALKLMLQAVEEAH